MTAFFSQSPDVFDVDESQVGPQPAPLAPASVPKSTVATAPQFNFEQEINQIDNEMATLSEVEIRLLKANYYRAVLDQPLFGDGDSVAKEVEDEIRQYTIKRLRQLMGIEQEMTVSAVKSEFSDLQLQTLRALADRMTGKLTALNVPAPVPQPNQEPQIRQVKVAHRRQPRAVAVTPPASVQLPTSNGAKTQVQPMGNIKPVPFPNQAEQDRLTAMAVSHREFARSGKSNIVDVALQALMNK